MSTIFRNCRFAIALLAFLWPCFSALAQADSLWAVAGSPRAGAADRGQALAELSGLALAQDYDSALRLAERSMGWASQSQDPRSLMLAHGALANAYFSVGDWQNSFLNDLAAKNLAEKLEDSVALAMYLSNIGTSHFQLGNLPESSELFLKVRTLYAQMGNQEREATANLNLGVLSVKQRRFEQAREFFEFARESALARRDTALLLSLLVNEADMAIQEERPARADSLVRAGMGLLRTYSGATHSDRFSLEANLIESGFMLGRFDACERLLEQGRVESVAIGAEAELVFFDLWEARLRQAEGRLGEAIGSASRALKVAERLGDHEYQTELLLLLTELHRLNGEPALAYDYLLRGQALGDSLGEANQAMRLFAIKESQASERQKEQIRSLQAEAEAHRLIQRLLLAVLLLGAVFLVGAIVGALKSQRKNQELRASQQKLSESYAQLSSKNAEISQMNEEISLQKEELEQANAAKDKLFSIIGHDLRNPFNTIIGFSRILYENQGDLEADDIKDVSGRLYKASLKGMSLLENLLLWSRSQTGRIQVDAVPVVLRDLVEQNLDLVRPDIERKRIQTEVRLDPAAPLVRADPNMVDTILRNLLSNAVKFTHAEGLIRVCTERKGPMVEIRVADNGLGISPQNLEKVFQLGSGFTTPGTEQEKGSGLGLILCREFALLNNGEIRVESGIGIGTTFFVSLPFSA